MALPAPKPKLSVENYLEGEIFSTVRHEYVGGEVFAMAGTSEEHNLIALSLASALRSHLRGKPCKVFMSEVKVKVWLNHDIFYYPDIMVVCDPTDDNRYYKHKPKVLIEVISDSTRRTDEQEKLLTYLRIESLDEYVLVEQDTMQVALFSRSKEWKREVITGADGILTLDSLGFTMPLTQIYEGVGE